MNNLNLITAELDHFPVVTPKYRLHLIRRNTHKGLELEGTITIQRGKRSRTMTTGIVTTECLAPGDQILATTETRDGFQAWNMVDEIDAQRWIKAVRTQQLNIHRDTGGELVESQWQREAWGCRSRFVEDHEIMTMQCHECGRFWFDYDLHGDEVGELVAVCRNCVEM